MIPEVLTRRPALIGAAVVAVLSLAGVTAALQHRGPDRTWTLRVSTSGGELAGIRAEGLESWRGIPYAAPPVGDRRWRAPVAPTAWTGVRDASTYSAPCVQPATTESATRRPVQLDRSSEDCLYLNVNRPDDARRNLPVVVWLHGGGFFEGQSDAGFANSPGLVQRGVIVVTVNYRLGRLGFFAHPGLGGKVANFGLLDQMAALRWVRENIAGFGGDPSRVTLAGTSAGGMSVNALMASPRARGLFDRAIVESGLGDERPRTMAGLRSWAESAYPGLTARQLRALPATRLLDRTFSVFAGDAPILDAVLPRRPAAVFAAGDEARVPYLVGNTDGEFTDAQWRSLGITPQGVTDSLGPRYADILIDHYGSRSAYRSHVLDDAVFGMPALRLATEHARRAPSYRYRFAALGSPAPHSAEVPYVFDVDAPGVKARIADQISGYWAAFIATGEPGSDDAPAWPRADDLGVMVFGPSGAEAYDVDPQYGRLRAVMMVLDHERARRGRTTGES